MQSQYSRKNYYCEYDGVRITINIHSYTIITAHKIANLKMFAFFCGLVIEYFLEKRGIFMDTNVNIGNELKENYTEERNKLINVI